MGKKQTLKDIEKLANSLDRNLLGFGFSYLNYRNIVPGNISPSQKSEFKSCMNLRDSIFYRVGSINFHLNLLFLLDRQISKKLQSEPFDIEMQNNLMMYGGDQQLFFLDDIVFHLISLFEYLGNLIGFRFHGYRELRWKGAKRCCESLTWEKHKFGKEKIRNSVVHPVILKYQKKTMNKLEAYRSRRFHYEKDSAKRTVSMNLMNPLKTRFVVEVPKRLQTWIKKNVPQADTLCDAAMWLIKESFTAAHEILTTLLQDMKQASK